MSLEIQMFNCGSNKIRTIIKNNEPWFIGKDICEYFGDTNYRRSLARLDEDEKGVSRIDTPGGPQNMTVINEAGLYSLLFMMQPQQANLPPEQYQKRIQQVKDFKRWITHEVIPAIRKHGGYLTPAKIEEVLLNPDTIIRLATDLKAEREKRKQLETEIEDQKPKVLFANAVTSSKSSVLVGELAKILKQNGIEIGQNRLFEWLREEGYLCKSGENYNLPTQYSMELELMEIKKVTINNPDGSSRITRTPKITGKGQVYFVNKFLNNQLPSTGTTG